MPARTLRQEKSNLMEFLFHDFQTCPAISAVNVELSANIRGLAMSNVQTNEIFVSNALELQQAIENASGGERIVVAGGEYGELSLLRLDFPQTVTIVASDANDPPVFASLYMSEVSNITFDGVFVDFVPDEETSKRDSAVKIRKSSDIKNCQL